MWKKCIWSSRRAFSHVGLHWRWICKQSIVKHDCRPLPNSLLGNLRCMASHCSTLVKQSHHWLSPNKTAMTYLIINSSTPQEKWVALDGTCIMSQRGPMYLSENCRLTKTEAFEVLKIEDLKNWREYVLRFFKTIRGLRLKIWRQWTITLTIRLCDHVLGSPHEMSVAYIGMKMIMHENWWLVL